MGGTHSQESIKHSQESIKFSITLQEKAYLTFEERIYLADIHTRFSKKELSSCEETSIKTYLDYARIQNEIRRNNALRQDQRRITVQQRLSFAGIKTDDIPKKFSTQLLSITIVLPLSIYEKLNPSQVNSSASTNSAGTVSVAPSIYTLRTQGMFTTATGSAKQDEIKAQNNVRDDIAKIVSPCRMNILQKLSNIPNTLNSANSNVILPQKQVALILMRALLKDAADGNNPTMPIINETLRALCSPERRYDEAVLNDITNICRERFRVPTKDNNASLVPIFSDTPPLFSPLQFILYLTDCATIFDKYPKYFLKTSTSGLIPEDKVLSQFFKQKSSDKILQLLEENVSSKCFLYIKTILLISNDALFKTQSVEFLATLIEQTIRKAKTVEEVMNETRSKLSTEFLTYLETVPQLTSANDIFPPRTDLQKIELLDVLANIFTSKTNILIPGINNTDAMKSIGKKFKTNSQLLKTAQNDAGMQITA